MSEAPEITQKGSMRAPKIFAPRPARAGAVAELIRAGKIAGAGAVAADRREDRKRPRPEDRPSGRPAAQDRTQARKPAKIASAAQEAQQARIRRAADQPPEPSPMILYSIKNCTKASYIFCAIFHIDILIAI